MYMPMGRQTDEEKNRIRVSGEGTVAVKPDTATVILGVVTETKDLVGGQQQNARDAAKIIQSLLALGIPAENIRTSDYRIESMYDYKEGTQLFRGYKITHLLQTKIADLEKIGNAVDTAVQNGANYVSDIQFSSSKKDEYYKEALALAVKNAYEKAVTISGALPAKLEPIPYTIIEESRQARPILNYDVPMVKGASTTPVQPGQLIVEASVSADYRYS